MVRERTIAISTQARAVGFSEVAGKMWRPAAADTMNPARSALRRCQANMSGGASIKTPTASPTQKLMVAAPKAFSGSRSAR